MGERRRNNRLLRVSEVGLLSLLPMKMKRDGYE